MITHLHHQLEDLKTNLLIMASQTERAVNRSFEAFVLRDEAMAYEVIDADEAIDASECDMDNRCLRLLALDQPVALDLRLIITAMRMSVDLERIGDEAVIIAEQTVSLAQLPKSATHPLMEELMSIATRMLTSAVNAFRASDHQMALEVVGLTVHADALNMRIVQDCMENMSGDRNTIHRALHRYSIAKAMGRICDLSANLGESVIFLAKGVSIKHSCQPLPPHA